MLGHSDVPEEDAACILNSLLSHYCPAEAPPQVQICSLSLPAAAAGNKGTAPSSRQRGLGWARGAVQELMPLLSVQKPPETEPLKGAGVERLSGRGCIAITSVKLCVLHLRCLSPSPATVMTVITMTTQPCTHGFIHSNKEASGIFRTCVPPLTAQRISMEDLPGARLCLRAADTEANKTYKFHGFGSLNSRGDPWGGAHG